MRWIYISPHLDDAILSCGGLIWEQTHAGTQVEIWTVCTGDPLDGPLSPFAEVLHAEWGTGADTPARRRQEDMAACRTVGARYRHLSIPDCIYRSGQDGAWLYDPNTLMGEIHPADRPLVETLRAFLAAILKPEDILVCPLTVGGHADHRLTRAAVEALERPLRYYADIPYLLKDASAMETLTSGMPAEVQPVSETGLRAWQEGIAAYASQIGILFEDLEKMQAMIQSYAQHPSINSGQRLIGWQGSAGIRLWQST
ncbi:MAG: PIG-L family deacetylase [Chloroflexi bacterium]|nr:PIG-L family deacetylase [Chloroflexota bacterium]